MYDFQETLGKGHYSVVKLAQHVISKHYVAVKIIDKHKLDEVELKHLNHEVRVMKLLRHPNVVRLFEVVDTPSCLFLILELGEGGDMYEHIKANGKATDERARSIFAQLVRAMVYCHANRVAHRDLKPENVVFCTDPETQEEVVKVTDFGLCNNFTDDMMMETFCGSMVYSPPEVLLQEPYSGPKADIWSLGIMLYMIVVGALPFQEANDSETLIKILEVVYDVPEFVSDDCADLLSKMLVREPSERLSIKEIAAHPWLRPCINEQELSEINGTMEGAAKKIQVSKSLHDRVVLVLDREAGISKAQVDESLKKETYDYVASTYYLVLEQQIRLDQFRRNFAKAGHTTQERTASADGTDSPLSPMNMAPKDRLSLSGSHSVPDTPNAAVTVNKHGSRSGKTGQLRRRVRPLSATGQSLGIFSPTSPQNNLTDIASLALSPRLPPTSTTSNSPYPWDQASTQQLPSSLSRSPEGDAHGGNFPSFDQTWPGPWSGGLGGSLGSAHADALKQSFRDVNSMLRADSAGPGFCEGSDDVLKVPNRLLLPNTTEEDEDFDADELMSNLSRNSSHEGSVSDTPRSKKLVRSETCGSSLDGSFDRDDLDVEDDEITSSTPRNRLARSASHGASLMTSNLGLMAVTEEVEDT